MLAFDLHLVQRSDATIGKIDLDPELDVRRGVRVRDALAARAAGVPARAVLDVLALTARAGVGRAGLPVVTVLGDPNALPARDDHVVDGTAVVVVARIPDLRAGLDDGVDALPARVARVGGGRLAVITVYLVDTRARARRAPVRGARLAVAAGLLDVGATSHLVARVGGARLPVVAVFGAPLAGPTLIAIGVGAGVVVIAASPVFRDIRDALPARPTRVPARADLDGLADTSHCVARVGGALLPVVARLGDVRAARGCVARVGGARVAVIARGRGRLVLAHTLLDHVDRARDIVGALDNLLHVVAPRLRVAVVGGVRVVVVAVHLLPHALTVVPAVAGRALAAIVARIALLRARGGVGRFCRVLLGRLVGVLLDDIAAVGRVRGVRAVRGVAAVPPVVGRRLVGVARRVVPAAVHVRHAGLSAHAADDQSDEEEANHVGLHVRLLGASAPHSLETRMTHAPCACHVLLIFNETWSDSHRCDVFQTSGSRCVAKEGTLHTEPNDCKTSRNEHERIPYLAYFVKSKMCLK